MLHHLLQAHTCICICTAGDESELEYDVEFDEAWEDEEDVDDLRDVELGSDDDV